MLYEFRWLLRTVRWELKDGTTIPSTVRVLQSRSRSMQAGDVWDEWVDVPEEEEKDAV